MVLHDIKRCFVGVDAFESADYVFAYVDDGVSFESANHPLVIFLILRGKTADIIGFAAQKQKGSTWFL